MKSDLLLSYSANFSEKDSKKNVELPFLVKRGYKAIRVCYGYAPKLLESGEAARRKIAEEYARVGVDSRGASFPLSNLITVSVDDPNGFRGAGHRHESEQEIVLSKESASLGFLKGDLREGSWRVVLSIHCVVTENCRAEVSVFGDREDGE